MSNPQPIRSGKGAISEMFQMLTSSFVALHHMANGACEKAYVFEEDCVADSAIASLRTRHRIATELSDLQMFEDKNKGLLDKADTFLNNFKQSRDPANSMP